MENTKGSSRGAQQKKKVTHTHFLRNQEGGVATETKKKKVLKSPRHFQDSHRKSSQRSNFFFRFDHSKSVAPLPRSLCAPLDNPTIMATRISLLNEPRQVTTKLTKKCFPYPSKNVTMEGSRCTSLSIVLGNARHVLSRNSAKKNTHQHDNRRNTQKPSKTGT